MTQPLQLTPDLQQTIRRDPFLYNTATMLTVQAVERFRANPDANLHEVVKQVCDELNDALREAVEARAIDLLKAENNGS